MRTARFKQTLLVAISMTLSFLHLTLVWTPCLMHRCVCIWRYILQNYNYKLHFQNLSTYHILHVSIGTLAAENLDVCTACDQWDSNIQLTMGKDRRRLSAASSGSTSRGFRSQEEEGDCWSRRKGSHRIPSARLDGWRNGWMEKASRSRRPLSSPHIP